MLSTEHRAWHKVKGSIIYSPEFYFLTDLPKVCPAVSFY
jgi:hypothetical protein